MNQLVVFGILILFITLIIGVTLLFIDRQRRSKTIGSLNEEVTRLTKAYAPIINVDQAIAEREKLIISLNDSHKLLGEEYKQKRAIYEALLSEIAVYETDLEDISYGLYKPVYNFATSEDYKRELDAIRKKEKLMISNDQAIYCPIEWTVSGSRAEGQKMMKQYAKLMLRAFNGECDAIIARVSWNNIGTMEVRLSKAFEAINKAGGVNQISITSAYRNLKLSELKLEFELQEKLHAEKEEQRLIREQMREEEKALREIEQAQKKAEDEETRFQKALVKAREEAQRATGEQLNKLDAKIAQLEQALSEAQLQKARAISMAQLTKSGHIYIISNIGSFGEHVYKIGMTRRLEPLDRVRELGDASVPFSFDVHALVYSENAPELENKLHRKFGDRRLNLINNRREFFQVDIHEIENAVREFGLDMTLTKLAEAKEYRESQSIRNKKNEPSIKTIIENNDSFPVSL